MFDHRTSRKQSVRRRQLSCGLRRASLAAAVALTTITAASASPPAASSASDAPSAKSSVQLELMPPLPLQIGRLKPTGPSTLRTNPYLHQTSGTAPAQATAQAAARDPEPTAAVEAPPVLLRPAATVLTLRPISAVESEGASVSPEAEATEVTFVTPAVPPKIEGEGGTSVVHAAPSTDSIHFSISDDGVSAKATLEHHAETNGTDEPANGRADEVHSADEVRSDGTAQLAPQSRLVRPSIVAAPVAPITLEPSDPSAIPALKPMIARSEPARPSATRSPANDVAATSRARKDAAEKVAAVPARSLGSESLESEAVAPTLLRKSAAVVIPVPQTSPRPRHTTSAASDRQPVVIAPTAPQTHVTEAEPAPSQVATDQTLVIEVPAASSSFAIPTTGSHTAAAPQFAAAPRLPTAQQTTSVSPTKAVWQVPTVSEIPTVSERPAAAKSPTATRSSAELSGNLASWDFASVAAIDAEAILLRTAETQTIAPRNPIRRVQLEDREVCEAVLVGPHKLLLIGRQDGTTRLAVWSEDDSKPSLYEVKVGTAQPAPSGGSLSGVAQRLTETIAAAYPHCHVRVVTEGDGLAVHGQAVSQDSARAIMRLVRRACLTSVDDYLEIR